ncbi:MAG TPA: MFS transporter [Bacillus bacterium]|uniref:MFS transporter n=1 Tax=Siminovitchia fordii TaxID=254759 RepID=A0ABQ4K3N9_9BACI|nr:MFS transporter [Siminovitchia fordii]GIN20364.1 MFS transporter [Siminovitchia fordii]HBZ08287.1 MFS transporter [Bacillus sp. (in: firmicutes)]
MNFMKQMSMKKRLGLTFAITILFLDMLLYSVIIPLTPYYEENFKASPTLIGILFSSYSITLLLCTTYFGKLTDKIGRKKPIVIGLIGMTLSTIVFAHPVNFEILILARALQGVASAATWTASLALLADMFVKKERAIAMGLAMTSMSAGTLLGAPIGGFLIEFGGYATPFYTISVLMIAVMILAAIYLQDEQRPILQEPKKVVDLLRQREVIWILTIMVVSEGTLTMLEPILPIYLSGTFTGNSFFIGLMFGVITLAYGIMAPVSGFLIGKYTPSRVVLLGLLLSGIILPFVVIAKSTLQMVLALLFLGASMGLAVSPTLTMLGNTQGDGEENSYGALYGLFNIFFAVAAIIGPFMGGVLTDAFTSKVTILIASGAILLCTFGLSLTRKQSMGKMECAPSVNAVHRMD